MPDHRRPGRWGAFLVSIALGGCVAPGTVREPPPAALATPPRVAPAAPAPVTPTPPPPPPAAGTVARDRAFAVHRVGGEDSFRSLARLYLGDPDRDWEIAEFPGNAPLTPGAQVVIPLQPVNPTGIYPDGYQTVPILCYHRFGDRKAKMVVSPASFAAQMQYLADHGYRVVSLKDLAEFLAGRRALPRKAVVLTMDDGYRSNYRYAFPELKRHGFPATIFLYTDFLGGGAALRPAEMREMIESGLVDIQPHSAAHTNLGLPTAEEDTGAYVERLHREIEEPAARIRDLLGVPIHTFAYPYGDTNRQAIALLEADGYRLGATVQSGGNPAFAPPFLLRRTMVYGGDDLATFRAKLTVFRGSESR